MALTDCALAPRCTFTRHNDVLCPHRCCVNVKPPCTTASSTLAASTWLRTHLFLPLCLELSFFFFFFGCHTTPSGSLFFSSFFFPPFVSTRNKVPRKSTVPAQTAQRSFPYLVLLSEGGKRVFAPRKTNASLSGKATPKFDRKVTRSLRCAMQLLEG